MGFYKPFENLRESNFFSVLVVVSPISPPPPHTHTNLTVSVPRPVVFAFGSFSLSEHLRL